MEGNFQQGGLVRSGGGNGVSPYGGFDIRTHHHHHHQDSMNNQHHNLNPFTMVTGQSCDHNKEKNSVSEDEEPSLSGGDGANNKSTKGSSSPWQRVKWTDKMVKLLITAVSYIGDDSVIDSASRRKFAVLQKKGKWKSVSKVMAERGYHVSPQQCEDKFNDLNKRYKKLNDMLGRGICCEVVENPALLDKITHLNDKEKDDVRKIMSSKHLFYEEMCSYHNGNRLHLPHDFALQRSLQLALRNREDHDGHDDDGGDGDGHEGDDHDEYEEQHGSLKKMRHEENPIHVDALECNRGSLTQMQPMQKEMIEARALHLEEQKLHIQVEMLELEKQKFRWERFSKKRDQELERMRMENERMKLENDRMALELKQRELGVEL